MPILRCPICDKRFDASESPSPPFCSQRCRQVDLGRWLGEGYSVPHTRDDEEEDRAEADEEV